MGIFDQARVSILWDYLLSPLLIAKIFGRISSLHLIYLAIYLISRKKLFCSYFRFRCNTRFTGNIGLCANIRFCGQTQASVGNSTSAKLHYLNVFTRHQFWLCFLSAIELKYWQRSCSFLVVHNSGNVPRHYGPYSIRFSQKYLRITWKLLFILEVSFV